MPERKEREELPPRGVHPKYARDLLWEEDRYPSVRASAELSEDTTIASPVPRPPPRVRFHPDFLRTVDNNPNLFAVVTPIQVERFEFLLTEHPNWPFVESVLRALREGAWPWARPPTDFLMVHDLSYLGTKLEDNDDYAAFAQQEADKETVLGRFSQPFPVLLPGMACMPTYVIARKGKL